MNVIGAYFLWYQNLKGCSNFLQMLQLICPKLKNHLSAPVDKIHQLSKNELLSMIVYEMFQKDHEKYKKLK